VVFPLESAALHFDQLSINQGESQHFYIHESVISLHYRV
jgi:hypothetical protein